MLGRTEFKALLRWRTALRKELMGAADKEARKDKKKTEGGEKAEKGEEEGEEGQGGWLCMLCAACTCCGGCSLLCALFGVLLCTYGCVWCVLSTSLMHLLSTFRSNHPGQKARMFAKVTAVEGAE